jgi:beta-hydroxylase
MSSLARIQDSIGPSFSMLFTRFCIRPAKLGMEYVIRRSSKSGTRTYFDPRDFPWTKELEADWTAIRTELDEVLAKAERIPEFSDLSPPQAAIVEGTAWKSFFLFVTGEKVKPNCERCPRTTALLERIPGMQSAFFSILAGRTRIKPHTGPYGGVLRYHLGLRVPSPASGCGIRVGGDVAHWSEGKSMIFDDSHEHEAWNDTDEARVVLFVDFERPLPKPLSWVNRLVLDLVARAAFALELKANLARAEAR